MKSIRQFSFTAIMTCGLFLAPAEYVHGADVTMIDVSEFSKHGDAYLIETSAENILIDAAQYAMAKKKVVPTLQAKRIRHLDALYITHQHFDHYQGVKAILEANITIGTVYFNALPDNIGDCCFRPDEWAEHRELLLRSGSKLVRVKTGHKLKLSGAEIEVLYAHNTDSFINLNDSSLQLRLKVGKTRMLFTGDLGHKVGTLLSGQKKFESDVMTMPHHGAEGHAPESFMSSVSPSIAMFSISAVMSANARSDRSFKWAEEAKVHYCTSALNRAVMLRLDKESVTVIPERTTDKCKPVAVAAKDRRAYVNMAPIYSLLLD